MGKCVHGAIDPSLAPHRKEVLDRSYICDRDGRPLPGDNDWQITRPATIMMHMLTGSCLSLICMRLYSHVSANNGAVSRGMSARF